MTVIEFISANTGFQAKQFATFLHLECGIDFKEAHSLKEGLQNQEGFQLGFDNEQEALRVLGMGRMLGVSAELVTVEG